MTIKLPSAGRERGGGTVLGVREGQSASIIRNITDETILNILSLILYVFESYELLMQQSLAYILPLNWCYSYNFFFQDYLTSFYSAHIHSSEFFENISFIYDHIAT